MYARLWWSGTSLSALVFSCDDIHELCGGTDDISEEPVWAGRRQPLQLLNKEMLQVKVKVISPSNLKGDVTTMYIR